MAHLPDVSLGNAGTERLEERIQLPVQVLLRNSQLPLQEEEQLLFHQVDLGAVETKAVHVSVDVCVVGPVLVLW